MKKTINGIEYETFPAGRRFKELALDPDRKFIVCDAVDGFEVGDIVVLDKDDDTSCPWFKRLSDGEIYPYFIYWLVYYEEPQDKIIKEKDGIKVGDKVERNGYKGYVAVIDPDGYPSFLLRLEGYDGSNKDIYWNEDWYPEHEKKEEYNCVWASKSEFTVVEESTDRETIEKAYSDGELLHSMYEQVQAKTFLREFPPINIDNYTTHSSGIKLSEKCLMGLDIANEGYYLTNQLTKPTGNKFMSNIIKFAKDLTLTPDEKEFRKAGLQNDTGWTEEARVIVLNLKAKSLNYKDFNDLLEVVGHTVVSTLELAEMFVTYYDELLKIAKKFNKEDK